ncbi:MAG TPA: site-specific integrase [Candidatus Angelobacter sp.]|nr:site-specific integrase [Candidatus Angelobacter sp.]
MANGNANGWLSRKDGNLVYRWYKADGKEASKKLGADTMTDQQGWKKVGELGLGALLPKSADHDFTLGELAQKYLAYGKTKTGKPKEYGTQELDKQLVRDYVLPVFADREARAIEPMEVQDHLDGLSRGLQPKVRNIMSAIYRHSQKMGWLARTNEVNPMPWVSVSTTSDYEARHMTPQQAWSIAQALPLYEQSLVIADAATGCRISELLGLKWGDIDWKNNQIHIRRKWSRGRIGNPKSKSSKAPVPMHDMLAEVLKEWRKQTPYAKDEDWVFPSLKLGGSQPRTASTMVSDYIRPTATKLGVIDETVKRFGFHSFRHSLATFLIKEGANVDVVRKMLRHSKLDVTLAYTHMDSERIHAQGRMLSTMMASEAVN